MTSKKLSVKILHLYAEDMNVYGDHGNVLVLKKRIERYGYNAEIIEYNPGMELPENVDIIIGGGGQDSGQIIIQDDLQKIAPRLQEMAKDGTPMLMICGLYQLFGNSFTTANGTVIQGAGVLNVETKASPARLIGNITTESEDFGLIIGYENHSGKTTLGRLVSALGRVRLGAGNNGVDVTEGARFNNVIGTYLHGPILPKNPKIADFLIETAIKRKFNEELTVKLDDSLADMARKHTLKRPR